MITGHRISEDIEDAIQDFVIHSVNQVSIGITNENIESFKGDDFINVIWDKPDYKAPSQPYLTLNISGAIETIGKPTEEYKELDTWSYKFIKKITLSINSYSNTNYLGMLENLKNSLNLPSYRQMLKLNNIACWGTSEVNDISELLDTSHNGRGQIDLFLSYPQIVDDKPMEIHKVTINGTLNDDISISDDIDINE